jgi:hypothetical protein
MIKEEINEEGGGMRVTPGSIYILADDPSSLLARPDINGKNRTEEWRSARGDRGRQQQRSSTSDPSDLEIPK